MTTDGGEPLTTEEESKDDADEDNEDNEDNEDHRENNTCTTIGRCCICKMLL